MVNKQEAKFETNISRELRKKLGLPVTKDIVYVSMSGQRINVKDIEIIETGELTGLSTLEITLEDSNTKRICSEYLVEMQSKNFRR